MSLQPPASLKKIAAYLRKGDEFERSAGSNPQFGRCAYYCRLASVTQGLSLLGSLPASEKASAEAFLGALFEVVEASKQRYGILKEEEDADLAFMIEYGLSVFKKADDEDRAGAASKETAVRFVSAANVLDVPRILDLNDPKLDSMIKYAKGRAGEIVKAVNEGRPIPAPQGSDGSFDFLAQLDAIGVPGVPAAPSSTATPVNVASAVPFSPFNGAGFADVPSSLPIAQPYLPMGTPLPPSHLTLDQSRSNHSVTSVGAGAVPASAHSSYSGPAYTPFVSPQASAASTPSSTRASAHPGAHLNVADAAERCRFAIAALRERVVPEAVQRVVEALSDIGHPTQPKYINCYDPGKIEAARNQIKQALDCFKKDSVGEVNRAAELLEAVFPILAS